MHEGRWSAAHVEERLESDATLAGLGTVAAQVGQPGAERSCIYDLSHVTVEHVVRVRS